MPTSELLMLLYSVLCPVASPPLPFGVARVALAARCDLARSQLDGSTGIKLHAQIKRKIDKLQEPPPLKAKKALPAPDDKPKKRRGGKRCVAPLL